MSNRIGGSVSSKSVVATGTTTGLNDVLLDVDALLDTFESRSWCEFVTLESRLRRESSSWVWGLVALESDEASSVFGSEMWFMAMSSLAAVPMHWRLGSVVGKSSIMLLLLSPGLIAESSLLGSFIFLLRLFRFDALSGSLGRVWEAHCSGKWLSILMTIPSVFVCTQGFSDKFLLLRLDACVSV